MPTKAKATGKKGKAPAKRKIQKEGEERNFGNQHIVDPRQRLFLEYYLDPQSATFSNAYQSALRAGYSDEYSSTILSQEVDWLSDALRDNDLLSRAERRLRQILDFEPVDDKGRVDNPLVANQMKAITLVAKGLGKSKYSERFEHTGNGGKDLPITSVTIVKHGGRNNRAATKAD